MSKCQVEKTRNQTLEKTLCVNRVLRMRKGKRKVIKTETYSKAKFAQSKENHKFTGYKNPHVKSNLNAVILAS